MRGGGHLRSTPITSAVGYLSAISTGQIPVPVPTSRMRCGVSPIGALWSCPSRRRRKISWWRSNLRARVSATPFAISGRTYPAPSRPSDGDSCPRRNMRDTDVLPKRQPPSKRTSLSRVPFSWKYSLTEDDKLAVLLPAAPPNEAYPSFSGSSSYGGKHALMEGNLSAYPSGIYIDVL